MIFQDPMTSLNPTMKVGKQIEEMLKEHRKEMSKADRKTRAIELLSLVGISNPEARYDSYMFQTVERKARFISQIMSSGSPSREASDVDSTVLSLADMKAIATGDPNIAKRMELENQLTQMKLLKRAHADQQRSIRFRIDMQLQPTVDNLERLHGDAVDDEPKFHKAVEIRDQHLVQGVCGQIGRAHV